MERSIQSLGKVFLVTGSATTAAYLCHPYLLNTAAHVLNLDFRDSVTAFQTSFFSFLSLVFAIFSGNTMAFLYDVRPLTLQDVSSEKTRLLNPASFRSLLSLGLALSLGPKVCSGRRRWLRTCTLSAWRWRSCWRSL